MPDLIGEIGLDTAHIQDALDRVSYKITQLGQFSQQTTTAITAAAFAIGIWARNITDAAERADKLNQAIQSVSKSLSASEYNTTGGLEGRLKEIDDVITKLSGKTPLLDSFIDKIKGMRLTPFGPMMGKGPQERMEDAAIEESLKKRIEIQQQLAEKVAAVNKVLELQLDGQDEAAKLDKIRLDYAEKIGAAYAAGNGKLAVELKVQQSLTEEMAKQLGYQQRMKFDKQGQKEQLQIAAEDNAARQKTENISRQDTEDYEAQKRADNIQFAEDKRRRSEELKDLARTNRQSASDAATQTNIGDQRQKGRGAFANELEVRQSFLQRKREAIANHNDDQLREIELQEKQALRDASAAELQTPAQARSDRREQHKIDMQSSKQDAREAELRRRAANGESSRAIEEQIGKDYQRAKFAGETDIAKKEAMQAKSWTQEDATNLKIIAAAYQGGLK